LEKNMAGTAQTSGLLAAGTTTVYTGRGTLNSFIVTSDGTNAATCTIYDNTAGSGTVLAKLFVTGANGSEVVTFSDHIRVNIGITVVLSGTGSGATIHYGA
jgi:hypothetical protein